MFLTISFQAILWALIAGGFALIHLILALAAFLTPRRDRGHIWIGITSSLLCLMFAGNLSYLLTNNFTTWNWLLEVLLFRNIFGLLSLISIIITIFVVFHYDR